MFKTNVWKNVIGGKGMPFPNLQIMAKAFPHLRLLQC